MEGNSRIAKGTEHSLATNSKIGGEFKIAKNPEFLTARAKIFDELFAKQQERLKEMPKESILIKVGDKEVEGTSFVTTPFQVAKDIIDKDALKSILVAKVTYTKQSHSADEVVGAEDDHEDEIQLEENAKLWDLSRPLEGSCTLSFHTFNDQEGKTVFWHSSAHILGSCLENLYGGHLCIGPPLKTGFYYDVYVGDNPLADSNYNEIEQEAKKIAKAKLPFQRLVLSKEEALEMFHNNPFKVQLISNKVKDGQKTTVYRCGNLIDLCLGPHVPKTELVKAFKVTQNGSSYWLGNKLNDSLQRVYAVTFPSEEELKLFIEKENDLKQRDHRKVGSIQKLFMNHEWAPGCAFFYPHGAHVYNKLNELIRHEYRMRGFSEVISPNMYNLRLWKTSGHYKCYMDNIFTVKVEGHGHGLKPMNCPGHCLMFDSMARSYKELPIRFADFGVLHRNELSGALHGLTRVRRFQQDDAHIFCRFDQIEEEIENCLDFLSYVYGVLGFDYELHLSTKPEKAIGDPLVWEQAEKALEDALNKHGLKWKLNPGDGAFYGPKIDIKLKDVFGRLIQCATIQLDFQLPIRFNLQYCTADNHAQTKVAEKELGEDHYLADELDQDEFTWKEQPVKAGYERPVIIHRAILGSFERLISILIEQSGGKWDFWISPRQIKIVSIKSEHVEYAKKIEATLKHLGYTVENDYSGSTIQKKVKVFLEEKFNYLIIVGKKEMDENKISVRTRENVEIPLIKFDDFLVKLSKQQVKKSKKEIELIQKGVSEYDLNLSELNEKLEFNLYFNGDEISEVDKSWFAKLENVEVNKFLMPHLAKWQKLVKAQL